MICHSVHQSHVHNQLTTPILPNGAKREGKRFRLIPWQWGNGIAGLQTTKPPLGKSRGLFVVHFLINLAGHYLPALPAGLPSFLGRPGPRFTGAA